MRGEVLVMQMVGRSASARPQVLEAKARQAKGEDQQTT
jgi:hypothetical protein